MRARHPIDSPAAVDEALERSHAERDVQPHARMACLSRGVLQM